MPSNGHQKWMKWNEMKNQQVFVIVPRFIYFFLLHSKFVDWCATIASIGRHMHAHTKNSVLCCWCVEKILFFIQRMNINFSFHYFQHITNLVISRSRERDLFHVKIADNCINCIKSKNLFRIKIFWPFWSIIIIDRFELFRW